MWYAGVQTTPYVQELTHKTIYSKGEGVIVLLLSLQGAVEEVPAGPIQTVARDAILSGHSTFPGGLTLCHTQGIFYSICLVTFCLQCHWKHELEPWQVTARDALL